MKVKIGRNEPCPCGSTKKYKNCCIDKQDTSSINISDDMELKKGLDKLMKDSRIKQCLHPQQNECSEDIIKAHSIQNNGILSKLSDNGKLIVIKPTVSKEGISFGTEYKGRKIASTFTGFCGKHDKIFSEIENKPFKGEAKQNFLLAYRAFAFEAHKKAEALNVFRGTVSQKPSILKTEEFLTQYRSYQAAIVDIEHQKKIFDQAILTDDYSVVESYIVEMGAEANIAVCSSVHLEYDLLGNPLNDVTSLNTDETLKPLMFNLFPQDGKTFAVLSWMSEDNEFFKEFINQLRQLDKNSLLQYLNNFIVSYIENFYINPTYWDTFSTTEKNALYRYFKEDVTLMRFHQKRNLMKSSKFDLFKNLKEQVI
ncbi:YecA family protein [Bacillus salipaludis]|uniref:YecA family protein n=1 Tax=Bacillus salipaludis TaxID=2547811 RepID=UPI00140464E5|nr:SEC-C metal-binding domain-containing protein [Bacillus salipaludis]